MTRTQNLPSVDVVVVGARPAGAGTALLLARAGYRVLVVDRSARGSDTLSTHALMRGGVHQLDRWGLLDRIVAAGTPPIHRVTFDYAGDRRAIDLAAPLYAPRRTVLDVIRAAAAADAGAAVRRGVHVDHLVRAAEGRVVGVAGRDRHGLRFEVHARIVVGADGMRSFIARDVAAPVTHRWTASAASVYGYANGLATAGIEWLYAPGVSGGLIPTNDGRTCVFVGTTSERFMRALRFDLRRAFHQLLGEVSPTTAQRVSSTRWTGPLRGFAGTPSWLRRPYGDGWALVGDAGGFTDPISAHGITDALRDADLLARAVRAGTDAALAGYGATRDALSLPLFAATDALASLDWSFAEAKALHHDLSRAMKAEQDWLAANATGLMRAA
jgi:flavin-dependent dehydrogenase